MTTQPKITKFFVNRLSSGSDASLNNSYHDASTKSKQSSPLKTVQTKSNIDNNENDSPECIQIDIDPADVICERSSDDPEVFEISNTTDDAGPSVNTSTISENLNKSNVLSTPAKRTPSRVVLSNSASKSISKRKAIIRLKTRPKLNSPLDKTPAKGAPPKSEPSSPTSSTSSDVLIEDGIIGMKVRSPTNYPVAKP